MTYWSYIKQKLRPHRRRLVLAIAAMLGIMLIDLGAPLIIAVLIDVVVAQSRWELLAPLMILFGLRPFAAAVCRFFSSYTITQLSQRLILDIRLDLYRHVHRLSCRFLQNTATGKLMERLRGDVQQIQTLMSNQTPQLIVQVVTGLVMIGVMFALSVKLTLMVLAAMVLYMLNYKWFVKRIQDTQRRYRHKNDQLSALAQERLAATVLVKTYGTERRESRRFLHGSFVMERRYHRFRILSSMYAVVSRSITWGTYAAVILVGGYLAVRGDTTYGAVTAVTAFSFRLLHPAAMLAELSNHIQQATVSLDRIFDLMNAEHDPVDAGGRRLDGIRGEVEFRDVNFQYEPDKPVLRGFNLHVRPGQTVAFVGQTGCGKSTIISLLYRFYEITCGQLLIDGHDIRQLDARWYRQHLAIVPQEPIVFDTTIAENISYGRPHASREQIMHAARTAELGELIDGLPDGLDTILGEWGVKLSVGEKQRLCIARAILSDPAILVFDEATSSLDTHSEIVIQKAMKKVMTGRTCFVVAHRLSTIVNSDLIVVMDKGEVLEAGTHAELMRRPAGRYRKLFLTQATMAPLEEASA